MRTYMFGFKTGCLGFGLLVGTVLPVAVAQQSISTATPKVEIHPKGVDHRICWYGGKEYSRGSIVIVGTTQLVCQAENQFETNGRLTWHQLDKPSQKSASN
ncbi:DUF1496 domain-containing protein [Photobacterium atrarenae]|uniref:YnjH family protein n=1 Tax=Photobacterium atrarenae TaxID=865757 RepID=A0ABY5GMD4_9GAMM|nr:DUF1496 domain-containing protein [Photobacterium atrarenae]UTV30336.1 YnjH family protein [Photobacterium atrarenae]